MVNSLPKHKVPTSVKARLQLSLARMYFVQVWLLYVIQFVIYFLKCSMFIRAKYVLQFSRRDDLDPAIQNRRIVWTFIFEAAGRKAESSISYITDYTLLHVLSRNYK